MIRFSMFKFAAGGVLSVFSIICAGQICLAEHQVNVHTADDQMDPDVAISPSGDFVVVWESQWQEDDWSEIYGRRFAADGQPLGGEFRINNTTAGIQADPAIAMDPAGNFVVTWRSPDGEYSDVYARHYNAAGAPLGNEFQVNTYTPGRQIQPDITMNDSGDYVIAWESSRHTPDGHFINWDVCGRAYDSNGTPISAEFTINQQVHGHAPSVAMDDSGDFTVAYVRGGDTPNPPLGYYLRMRQYNADGTAKDDAIDLGGNMGNPQIEMDGLGNFVMAWAECPENDWRENNIHTQRFNPDATPRGPGARGQRYSFRTSGWRKHRHERRRRMRGYLGGQRARRRSLRADLSRRRQPRR